MLTLPPSVRIFIATQPVDIRRSFDGLAALTVEILKQDPLTGHLFVFRNKSGDRVKILFWDRSGYCLFYKRLEKSRFNFPESQEGRVEVEAAELALLLEGIDLKGAKRRERFVIQPAI